MVTRSARDFWLAALGLLLLTVAIHLPSLLHPLPISDEAVYSVIANEIVDGGRLYVDAVDRKPPLLFWTYAAVFKAAGKFNWMALHAVAVVWILGTMAGLYVIDKRLFDRNTGLIAALLYSVFQPWAISRNDNLAFNGEVLMNLPVVWAWAIALRRSSSPVRPELLAAGALLCAGFLLKQPAAIAAVPLAIYLLLPSYRVSRGLTRTASITHAAMLTIGFFGALGLVTIVFWEQGILRDAFYWTVTNHVIEHVFWTKGTLRTFAFIAACLPLLLGAAMAYRGDGGVWAGKSAERTALFGLLVASAIGTAAGARFSPHYYIQLIPPLALLAAPHYSELWSARMQPRHCLLRPAVMYGWLAVTVIAFSTIHWFGLAPQRKPSETGRYLLEHSAPEDRIFIWGQKSKIYLEARRRPACRYIFAAPLTGYVFGSDGSGIPTVDTRNRIVPGAWRNLEQDFARHPPAYVVDLRFDPKHAPYPVHNFPIQAKLLAEQYQPVARTAEGVVYQMR
jgi:4-amino-4-deoxy-L-arabinose transferase-like glycosyltransferase